MGVFCMNGGGIAISLSCVVVVKPWVYISCTCPCGGVVKSEVAGEGSKPLCVELGEKFEINVLSVRKEESTLFQISIRLFAIAMEGFTLLETAARSHGE